MAISFKSVGDRTSLRKFKKTVDPSPIGIITPVRLGTGRSGLFEMNFNIIDQIHDNIKNLILTNSGERLGSYYFGANLRDLCSELTSKEDFDNEAMLRINETVKKFMPFVELETFESEFGTNIEKIGVEPGLCRVTVRIIYNVPRLRVTKKALAAVLYVMG
tara:strand:- start:590 stop:1072 length:483 start_codon:yes stop_codon:yes gene_type:complete